MAERELACGLLLHEIRFDTETLFSEIRINALKSMGWTLVLTT